LTQTVDSKTALVTERLEVFGNHWLAFSHKATTLTQTVDSKTALVTERLEVFGKHWLAFSHFSLRDNSDVGRRIISVIFHLIAVHTPCQSKSKETRVFLHRVALGTDTSTHILKRRWSAIMPLAWEPTTDK
jgi:hypothetical protein